MVVVALRVVVAVMMLMLTVMIINKGLKDYLSDRFDENNGK